jgi:ureidoglycolate lyase
VSGDDARFADPGVDADSVRVAAPLTAEAFAAFGQVLQGSGAPTERKAFASRMQNGRPQAKPNMTWMRILPAMGPIRIEALERHPYSNQTFVPLAGTRHLVAVCPSGPDGAPIASALRVFVADGSQAVNYDANVWHAPRTALGAPGEFVMFRWDDGSEFDTETIELPVPIRVEIPRSFDR